MPRKTEAKSIAQTLRKLKHADPFTPFRLKTARGETITVIAPDDFIISPAGKTAFFNPQESGDTQFLQLGDVLSINLLRNGRRRTDRRAR
jgi:hypothetical protein